MRTSVFKIRRAYNADEIKESIGKIGTFHKMNKLVTTYDGRIVCETNISKKYFDFDFTKFTSEVLDEIEDYFTPEHYTLKISAGFQELRLVGEELTINGERYAKMFNLLNSTNREYALQMNIGLIRLSNGTGVVLNTADINAGMLSRHFYIALPERVKTFVEKLKTFNIVIDKQAVLLERMSTETVSFSEVVKKFIAETDKKTGKVSSSAKLRTEALGKKLLKSGITGITADQVKLLSNPTEAMKGKKVDVEVSAEKMLNVYTEIYKNYNSCVQRTETERILRAIGK